MFYAGQQYSNALIEMPAILFEFPLEQTDVIEEI